MIIAAVDDLIFASKIGQTARHLRRPIVFVRSKLEALGRAREQQATMLIVDLNSRRADAIELIKEMKRDPQLRAIRIVGFVAHVQGGVINEARRAGCDRVLARSVFSNRLAEILQGTEVAEAGITSESAPNNPQS